MAGRVLVWGGGGVAVAALAGMVAYSAAAGLDRADKLASVVGACVAVAGLAVAVYGLIVDRRAAGGDTAARAEGSGERSNAIGGDNNGVVSSGDGATVVQQRARASGRSRVYQVGGDLHVDGR
ncbi:hypothetical protein AGRA3207_002128 [Actinomadura graeca]|uniref:Uncharacterized protein n=1 Tax=Actinomadura graeca TaxID=2750812 RepID=A0ABX8QR67_9ACTN|nr:hypothetical protein [Actinomadura graeca]QXJ21290.1 hypothetical protein AGRA3207_002128 [Actinomadura graeca]